MMLCEGGVEADQTGSSSGGRSGEWATDEKGTEPDLQAMTIGPAVLRSRTMAKYFSSVRLIFLATRSVFTGLPCTFVDEDRPTLCRS